LRRTYYADDIQQSSIDMPTQDDGNCGEHMDNTLSIGTIEVIDQSDYVVESGYLRTRISFFEDAYKSQFSDWSEFFIAYSKHQLPNNNNLDYDEWAFLCGQMLYEQTANLANGGEEKLCLEKMLHMPK